MHVLSKAIIAGDVRALARGITYIENQHKERLTILREIYPYTNRAYKLGLTGAPGAGKSTLVNKLTSHLRELGLTVGVIAVDPTSPFTGGALLGDRVRMANHFTDPGVYIRSMGTRGHLGGLARATKEAVQLVDAFGVDIILIETVGVGQAELDIMQVADSTAVILTPNGGDSVQAFKAGIMEIADLYVINKADIQGADKLKAEIEHMLDIAKHDAAWRPPVIKTSHTAQQGAELLWTTFQQHRSFQLCTEAGAQRQQERQVSELKDILQQHLQQLLEEQLQQSSVLADLQELRQGQQNPYVLAERLMQHWATFGLQAPHTR